MIPQKMLPKKMKDVHEWAEKQLNRAAVFIRSMSMAASNDEDLLEEIRSQLVFATKKFKIYTSFHQGHTFFLTQFFLTYAVVTPS